MIYYLLVVYSSFFMTVPLEMIALGKMFLWDNCYLKIILTETWFSDEKKHQFESSDLNQNGYKSSVSNQKSRIGSGAALVCRSDINMRRMSVGVKQSLNTEYGNLVLKTLRFTALVFIDPRHWRQQTSLKWTFVSF